MKAAHAAGEQAIVALARLAVSRTYILAESAATSTHWPRLEAVLFRHGEVGMQTSATEITRDPF